MPTLSEQLAHWAKGHDAPEVSEDNAAARANPVLSAAQTAMPRDIARGDFKYQVPKTLVEAEMRLRECEESITEIDRQLAARDSADASYADWRRRAETARRGYEYEVSRMTTCIRVFRQEQAADRAAFAVLERERDDARDACRKLAAEVERLTAALGELRTKARAAAVNAAFVEVAQIVLAEVTFVRILERARDRTKAG